MFIARRDVKARQHGNGAYMPVTDNGKADGNRVSWKLADILEHLARNQTYGHYLLDRESMCKLFAFDVDLTETGWLPRQPYGPDNIESDSLFVPANPRTAWLDRAHPGRSWMKLQFKLVANKLMRVIHEELEIPCAAAYSGNKGIHVYGFTGHGPAPNARTAAQFVLDSLDEFEPVRGGSFFRFRDQSALDGYPNLTIELFPKQDSLDGKDLGNLMRLPLGRNLKTKDPTFFIDMTTALGEMKAIDPMWALGEGALNPWRRPDE
jgi:hypothetical protein